MIQGNGNKERSSKRQTHHIVYAWIRCLWVALGFQGTKHNNHFAQVLASMSILPLDTVSSALLPQLLIFSSASPVAETVLGTCFSRMLLS